MSELTQPPFDTREPPERPAKLPPYEIRCSRCGSTLNRRGERLWCAFVADAAAGYLAAAESVKWWQAVAESKQEERDRFRRDLATVEAVVAGTWKPSGA